MKTLQTADQIHFGRMTTGELRESFLVEDLFGKDRIDLVYTDLDRAVVGSAVPVREALLLEAGDALRAAYFTERREIGVINVGGAGSVTVDSTVFPMAYRDCLYIGRGSREIVFRSDGGSTPAVFFLLSYPAHVDHPTTLAHKEDAEAVSLGSSETANRRTVFKYIHPGGVKSCQLVMGITEVEAGSVWNTMPPHTHARRTEVYLYFDLAPGDRVLNFMGTPRETRHVVMADRQAVVSPSWSIHSGVGTRNYTFIWGMGGENQAFDDMDGVEIASLL